MFGSCAAAQQHHRDAHLKSQRKFSVDEAEGDVIGEDRLATSTARPTLTMSSEIADRETTSTNRPWQLVHLSFCLEEVAPHPASPKFDSSN